MDCGGRGWGKGEEKPARRGYWKTKYPLILPLISCVPLHFRKWAGNQSKWVKLKTESTLYWLKKKKTRRADKWNWEVVFFQPSIPPPRSQLWADICCTLYFLEYSCRNLAIWQFFFHLKVTLKQKNKCIRRFTHHNLFDTNWHTLVKWCGWLFSFFLFIHSEERKFSQGAK